MYSIYAFSIFILKLFYSIERIKTKGHYTIMVNKELGDLRIVHLNQLNEQIQEMQKTDTHRAIQLCMEYITLAIDSGIEEHIIYAYYLLAYNYTYSGHYIEAIDFYHKCIQANSNQNNAMYYRANIGLGLAHKQIGQYKKALDYYTIALQGNLTDQLGSVYNNLSVIYRNLNDFDKAIEYAEKAYSFLTSIHNIQASIDILSNIGALLTVQKKYIEAENTLNKSLQLATLNQLPVQRIHVLNKLAQLYFDTQLYDKAERCIQDALFECDETHNTINSISLQFLYGQVFCAKNKCEKAINIFVNLLNNPSLKDVYTRFHVLEELVQVLAKNERYKEAFQFQKDLISLKNEIFQRETESKLQSTKLKLLNKEQEMELLRLREIRDLNIKLEEKNNELLQHQLQLEDKNNDLLHFSYALSHDLKEPIRQISNFTDLLSMSLKSTINERDSETLSYIKQGCKRMTLLVNEMHRYASLESKELKKETIVLDNLVGAIAKEIKFRFKDVESEVEIDPLPTIQSNPIFVKQVFENILSNAFKYRNTEILLHIKVTCVQHNNVYQIQISDNGIGIPQNEISKVFKLFKRAGNHKQIEGTGVGLAFCAKIMQKLGGSIRAISNGENKGSTFVLEFPLVDNIE